MTDPYYQDDQVTLYHGDCREITEWTLAKLVITDPPYGTDAAGGGYVRGMSRVTEQRRTAVRHRIAGDADTTVRDEALALVPYMLGLVFGSALRPAPPGSVQALGYLKPPDAGAASARGGYRRDLEVIYMTGAWPIGAPVRSSVIATRAPNAGGASGIAGRAGHPHAKPLDVLEALIQDCPSGAVCDPFAGSGSTLVAARNLGRHAIGVEIDERYCETAARRLSAQVIDL